MINVYMLPAGKGDFFVVEYGIKEDYHYILIDGGDEIGTYPYTRALSLLKEKGAVIDAIIFTHIDDDHICGALCALCVVDELPKIERIYLNTGEVVEKFLNIQVSNEKPEMVERGYLHADKRYHSVSNALSIKEVLEEKQLLSVMQPCVVMGETLHIGNAELKIISPGKEQLECYLREWNKKIKKIEKQRTHAGGVIEEKKKLSEYKDEKVQEDKSPTNGSSIAFIFEYGKNKIAFLGDAFPTVCEEGVRMHYPEGIRVDLLKIPHHGSCRNFSDKLYEVLQTEYFLLSTDGTSNKPHPVFLAKLFAKCPRARVFCNYEWFKKYKFEKSDIECYIKPEKAQICFLGDEKEIVEELKIQYDVNRLGKNKL